MPVSVSHLLLLHICRYIFQIRRFFRVLPLAALSLLVASKKLKFIYSAGHGDRPKATCTFSFTCQRPKSETEIDRRAQTEGETEITCKTQKTFHFLASGGFFWWFFCSSCRYLYLNAACGTPLRLLLCNESFVFALFLCRQKKRQNKARKAVNSPTRANWPQGLRNIQKNLRFRWRRSQLS